MALWGTENESSNLTLLLDQGQFLRIYTFTRDRFSFKFWLVISIILLSNLTCCSLTFFTEPVIRAFMPKGFQSVKLGLTDELVGGAIKAALSIALNCPELTKLFETTDEICIPILLDFPSSPVKFAIAICSGSTWPELILILKSSADACIVESENSKIIIL